MVMRFHFWQAGLSVRWQSPDSIRDRRSDSSDQGSVGNEFTTSASFGLTDVKLDPSQSSSTTAILAWDCSAWLRRFFSIRASLDWDQDSNVAKDCAATGEIARMSRMTINSP